MAKYKSLQKQPTGIDTNYIEKLFNFGILKYMEKIKIENHTASGGLWIGAWLFTLGYLQLDFFWEGVKALILWPYYLGIALSSFPN